MRLIDADALIEQYKAKAADEWNKKVAPMSWAAAWDEIIDDIEDEATVGGWISVKERMPPAGKVLLVARKYKEPGKKEIRYVEMGELMDDCTWISDSDEYKINRKYHSQPYAWMPLPEPPKGENDELYR